MIGAIILTIYHEEGVRRQDLFSQVATEHQSTVTFGVSPISQTLVNKK